MAKTFTAQVDAWVTKTEQRLDLVVKGSTEDVIRDAQTPIGSAAEDPEQAIMGRASFRQGFIPVDTGFLRNSLVSSLWGGTSLRGAESYVMVVAGMEAGDVAEFGWTANYARHVEYGANGVPPRFFVGTAVRKWQRIVEANIEAAKARAA